MHIRRFEWRDHDAVVAGWARGRPPVPDGVCTTPMRQGVLR